MAEQNAGSIAVELALRSSTFETQMKRAAASVRGIDDEFKVSKAEAEAAGKRFDELGAKGEAASRKLELQEAACQKYSERLEKLRKDLETTAKGQQELAAKLEAAKKAHADSAEALKAHAKAGDLDEASMRALEVETARLKKEEKSLQESYDAGNRALVAAQGKINSTEQAYNKLRIETARTREEADKLTAALESAQKRMEKFSGATGKIGNALTLGLTAPVIAAGTAAATSAVKWEDAFAGVRKTVDATESGYARLQKQIVAMSEEIPVSKEEIAGIAAGAGQLGVAEKNVMKFTRVMADLGVSTDLTGEAAATMFAQYANITGMKLDNVDRLGSMIVDLGNNTSTAESKIGEMMQRLAGAGSIVGLTDAQIAGISATLSSLGIEAEAGGTAMSKALSQIDSAVISGGGKLNAYAKIAGVSAKEFSTAWKGDPVAALQLFTNGLGQISAAGGDVNAALKTVGISEVRMTDMMKRLSTSGDMLTKTVRRANAAWEDNTALTDEAAERYGTTASQIQITQNKLSNMATTFGNAFLPTINDGLDAVGNLAQKFANLDDGVRNNIIFGAGAAALTGPVMKAISGVTGGISALLKGVQSIRSIGGIAGIFSAIPAAGPVAIGLAATAVGGLALNWLSARDAMKEYEEKWKNIDFALKDNASAEIRQEIDKAVAAADRIVEITVQMSEKQESLMSMLDGFASDDKITKKEKNSLTSAINTWVDDGISQAKLNTQTKIDEYNAVWDSMGLTDEERDAEINAIKAKSDGNVQQLQALKKEASELINGFYTKEIEITEENKGKLDDLLGQIVAINTEIELSKQALESYTPDAYIKKAQREGATKEDTIVAFNSVIEWKQASENEMNKEIEKKQTELQMAAENAETPDVKIKAEAALELAWDEADAQSAELEAEVLEKINALAATWDFSPEELSELLKNFDLLALIAQYNASQEPDAFYDQVRPKIIDGMKTFFPKMSDAEIDEVMGGLYPDDFFLNGLKEEITKEITKNAESGVYNPIIELLNASAGAITPNMLDGLDGKIRAAIMLVDFKESGGSIGENIIKAMGLGITENQGEATGAAKDAAGSVIDTMKKSLGIKSPSKEFMAIGYWSMIGLKNGFADNKDLALAPLKLMILNDLPPIGAGMVDALIGGISSRRQALVDEVVGAVRLAISSAQIEANGSPISIPVTLDTSSISMRKLSKELARL